MKDQELDDISDSLEEPMAAFRESNRAILRQLERDAVLDFIESLPCLAPGASFIKAELLAHAAQQGIRRGK